MILIIVDSVIQRTQNIYKVLAAAVTETATCNIASSLDRSRQVCQGLITRDEVSPLWSGLLRGSEGL
jgi:hypothetical protein